MQTAPSLAVALLALRWRGAPLALRTIYFPHIWYSYERIYLKVCVVEPKGPSESYSLHLL